MNPLQPHHIINVDLLSKWMPGAFLWKKDIDSVYTEINQDCAALFGFKRKSTLSGFTDDDIPCGIAEFSDVFRQQDRQVVTTGRPLKILEMHRCANRQWKVMLNTKNPLYDEHDSIIGTFAYCTDITNQLGQIQTILSSLLSDQSLKTTKNKKGSYILHQDHHESDLTSRQMDCLYYLLRGKTAKEIAEVLQLSKRTIEYYITHIKDKFSCCSKSELIELAISKGYMNVIPECVYKKCTPKSLIQPLP